MIIALYNSEANICFMVISGCTEIEIYPQNNGGSLVKWNGGEMVAGSFLVLDEGTLIAEGDNVTALLDQDRKSQFIKKTNEEQLTRLQDDSLAMQDAINFLLGI